MMMIDDHYDDDKMVINHCYQLYHYHSSKSIVNIKMVDIDD